MAAVIFIFVYIVESAECCIHLHCKSDSKCNALRHTSVALIDALSCFFKQVLAYLFYILDYTIAVVLNFVNQGPYFNRQKGLPHICPM